MKYIGIILTVIGVSLAVAAYRSGLRRSTAALTELLRLVSHIRARVSDYLEPPSVWARGYSSDTRGIGEMLEKIRNGAMPRNAYLDVMDSLDIPKEAKELLLDFFTRLGRDAISAERGYIKDAEVALAKLVESERKSCAERSGIASVIAFLVTAGGIMIVI